MRRRSRASLRDSVLHPPDTTVRGSLLCSEQTGERGHPCCGELGSRRTLELQHHVTGVTAQKVQWGEKLEGLSGAGAMVAQADREGPSEWGQVG